LSASRFSLAKVERYIQSSSRLAIAAGQFITNQLSEGLPTVIVLLRELSSVPIEKIGTVSPVQLASFSSQANQENSEITRVLETRKTNDPCLPLTVTPGITPDIGWQQTIIPRC
jgi:hypothetical protein